MTASNYAPSIALLLLTEGGFVNNPHDNGGATNKGVTQHVYDMYRKAKGLQPRSVNYITNEETGDIYKSSYWDAINADKLPAGIDYATFDFAVNSGMFKAVHLLQAAINHNSGKPPILCDGDCGPVTTGAVKACNLSSVIATLGTLRLEFMRGLSDWGEFGRGWTNRVNAVNAAAIKMIAK